MSGSFLLPQYFLEIVKSSLFFSDSPDLKKTIDLLFETWKNSGTVFTMGCGGSASTATHFAADLAKTVIADGKKGFKAISLVDNIPLVSAWTNDKGWGSIFAGQLDQWITASDVLIGISVHGGSGEGDAGPWSQNLVQAMKLAKDRKAKVIGLTGFDGGAMRKMADVSLVVPINSEPYGTPGIEACHVVLQHGIIYSLKDMIKNYAEDKNYEPRKRKRKTKS